MQRQPKRKSAANYQIVVQGKIPTYREQWFEGMRIRYDDDGNSFLRGELMDQAALHGVLEKIRDLGLALISVNKIENVPEGERYKR